MRKIAAWITVSIVCVGLLSGIGYRVYNDGWIVLLELIIILIVTLSIVFSFTWGVSEITKKINCRN